MNILSLFDGISCCRVALERANIQVDKYYASEIDKYAIQVAQHNYPDTIQLGDINNWRNWKIDWASIDLVAGGSPCQGFSNAGKGLNFDDPRSALFFVFVDILNHIRNVNPNVKFLLENVKMKKEWLDIISKWLNVEPVEINSSLVSAQNRQRFYWTNIAKIPQPADKHIYLKDILITSNTIRIPEYGNGEKSRPLTCHYSNNFGGWYDRINDPNPNKQQIDILAENVKFLNEKNLQHLMRDFGSKGKILCDKDEKTNTLTASMGMGGGNGLYYAEQKTGKNVFEVKDKKVIIYDKEYKIDLEDGFWCFRKLTPIECERLQTLPDNYTDGISNSQRYKALGNGWTVDVIAHIFNYLLKQGEKSEKV